MMMPPSQPTGFPMSRREWLARSGMGMGLLGLAGVMHDSGHLLAAGPAPMAGAPIGNRPLAARKPHFPGKAKRVIHFFLNGGPSHVDTFDPKPMLQKYAGKAVPNTLRTERKTGAAFPSPFKFQKYGQSGIEVSEIFAKTAQHIDDIAVIRSMKVQVPNHEPSLMLMNCGDSVQARPSVGAWVLYGLGTENQNLPGFIAMCPGGHPIKGTENWQNGFLPGAFQGTFIDSKHETINRLIENISPKHTTIPAQRQQLDLLSRFNQTHRQGRTDPRLDARIQSFELAFRMQTEAADAFDINQEPQKVREMYGNGVHARQTLIARRLLERGVRYVQLWHGAGQPWDNHAGIEGAHRNLAREIDQPIAALLTDLKQRGMLEDTLVVWGGEFGRTPTVELGGDGKAQLGRDHNPYGFTVWMAGGGIKGGTVYGATDEFGFAAAENPVSVHDLHATMLHLLGFDHEQLTYRYAGRDFRLTDVHGVVIDDIVA
ncbi:DUF1501 domain-containing protein [Tuwongella immobilis]|uniref:Sulfatase n=1 Tax=Tuwongella immobilis TaxID=692036 RepID=A0A6C2YKS5_9BACT|nr:DUF1501 domain-containing protein [Tuwongella immobilis]VIP01713.1 secreted protein containing duf1501 : Uncharacterized protein OS=Singulisphaera acidiphila (strain ATCC BAA-1392 / DSM 18658 / VKM B-2454 / MOB10) GN=Sinac_6139 PE=4 SV=1: DUF1501 [Tuwongella immobilis]VTR99227.1 secreted protein containing duf1501 : Uncharacterized protein OS=Singulisphaera acidiphila (strain ATCC BAA-1392 / DSM 18658 / VKM B-2454 / MOB10) GN=Sinac_6139 PE=4 SV=1: DUF1501 [Tuwongella immobilis]